MAGNDRAAEEKPKRARVRSGCMRCRTKRRKCDEVKPVCGRCKEKKEICQWGARIVFRDENNRGLSTPQSSKYKKPKGPIPGHFEIQDITAEIIREQGQQRSMDLSMPITSSTSTQTTLSPRVTEKPDDHDSDVQAWEMTVGMDLMPVLTTQSQDMNTAHQQPTEPTVTESALPDVGDLSYIWPSPTSLGLYDDSIFLPGSAYLDAHSTLRSHLIQEVNASSGATRDGTPELAQDDKAELALPSDFSAGEVSPPRSALTEDEEFTLLENWIQEVAPWLDKFDSQRHFQHTLPIMARSHAHLRYSMLAASARQLERKERSKHTGRSLALYQKAIQLVLPELHTRSTPVIASCVVLCVLEMQSSSPKAWRQHLDGCAHLIQASGIHGFSGGINQALFWCFARMDVVGGLITSMHTLIPMQHWAPGTTLEDHASFFTKTSGFDAHACYAVYLLGHVLDMFMHQPHLASRVDSSSTGNLDRSSPSYRSRWTELWHYIDRWSCHRPDEMMPIHYLDTKTLPFPKILYSNPAAISGNQLYHTASILMLQRKPSSTMVTPKPRSIFWHARQACAISISNHHHGAWTNSIQPLWIAGQWMSHPSEQKAILELLERIERETGWGTKWRAEDLKEFWGD